MSFEITDRDLLGRIGRIKTKNGIVHTPAFFPVVDPINNIINIKELKEDFKISQLITNAYLVKRALNKGILTLNDIHILFNFDKVIMTDSGAYQLLSYGEIDITPKEIIELQEKLNSDISVILDIPTPRNYGFKEAEKTMIETINNAKLLGEIKSRDDILWVGPLQGGRHIELIKKCAIELGKLSFFQIYGIGGPTQYMKNYSFSELVDIIVTAKKFLPPNRPIHLFGAGHPLILPFLVGLGCDTFDSASYALYAKDNRYITPYNTVKLDQLKYMPCACDVCRKYEAKELLEMNKIEREKLLAKHNLWVILEEINSIKQAIYEGRLWELIEIKAKAHPRVFNALIKLKKYKNIFEKFDPLVKSIVRGIFYTSYEGLIRPEVNRHISKIDKNMSFEDKELLILLPQKNVKTRVYIKKLLKFLWASPSFNRIHVCTYGPPFGVIPLELNDIYPLSQYEKSKAIDIESGMIIIKALKILTYKGNYKQAIIVFDKETINKIVLRKIIKLLKSRKMHLKTFVNTWPKIETLASYMTNVKLSM